MFKEIIVNTFDTIFKNSNKLLQKLIIPIILLTILTYFMPMYLTKEFISTTNFNSFNLSLLYIPALFIFVLMMINISIAITTHRVSILGEDSVPSFGSYIFGKREFKFLFKSILMAIIIAIPVIASIFIPVVGIFLAPFIALFLLVRFSFIYPAISCDEKMSFKDAWQYTKKYNILLIFAVIIFPFIFALSVGFVYTLAIEFLIKLVSPHMSILYSFLNVFIMVFSISALSSVYTYIKPRPLNKIKKETEDPLREIQQSTRRGVQKIVIHDKHKISFEQLKNELNKQYEKLGFKEIAYDRKNAWIIKNPNNLESYVSLRYDMDEFTIQVKDSLEPNLSILKNKI